jgi:aminotransferase
MQTANRFDNIRESVIREMTRLAISHDAINLSQGFPDYDPPAEVLQAAVDAIQGGLNQYTITWGYPPLRQRLAELYTRRLGWQVEPDEHIVVTCGVTEALAAAMLAVLNPGDEIIILDPAHETFRPAAKLAGARPVSVVLPAPDFRLDPEKLAAAVTPRTRALILNTPHNPSGRVFDDEEIAGVIDVGTRNDLVLITDEIYDRILYDGREHICPGSLEPLKERTITIGGMGKTYAVTGWRLGYAIAPSVLARAVKPAHDFLTICAATPLQAAGLAALNLPDSFYQEQMAAYHQRRALMSEILDDLGFRFSQPQGAYYILADYRQLTIPQAAWDADRFARWMATDVGVAVVPGPNFYANPADGEGLIRFAYPKKLETLQAAAQRMARLKG